MTTDGKFMKQALAYAGAIGKVQGLLEFLRRKIYEASIGICRCNRESTRFT